MWFKMSMLGSKHMERQQTLRFPAAVELTKELLWKQELTDLAPPPSKPFLCTQRNDHTLTSNLFCLQLRRGEQKVWEES